jgi:hypothetical protein
LGGASTIYAFAEVRVHLAWPMAGFTWLVFLGEQVWDDANVLLGSRS